MTSRKQTLVNHVALVLDASSSMIKRADELIKVADSNVEFLAQLSQDLNQETRVSVYSFADKVENLIYDKDVLRLPSIKELYSPYGWTALRDAALKSQDDLSKTLELYDDHAYLIYILTDGLENASKHSISELSNKLASLPDNWTVAVLVPDINGKIAAQRYGFPKDNIAIWDTRTTEGLIDVGNTIRDTSKSFMTARATGVRGTKSLFSMGSDTLNEQTVAANLTPLDTNSYMLIPVVIPKDAKVEIRDFVTGLGRKFEVGKAFYQLSKSEKVQPTKKIVVQNKKTKLVYSGPTARQLVNLPDKETRAKPQDNPEFNVFIQSQSYNRHVTTGTQLLLIN